MNEDGSPQGASPALEGWGEEMGSAWLYRRLAECERRSSQAELFRELAVRAERQAGLWSERVRASGGRVPSRFKPAVRLRIVAWLARRFGVGALRPVLAATKVRGLSAAASAEPPETPFHTAAAEGRRHRGVERGGTLRAAVFGANDGLVSNASLILGVAGAAGEGHLLLLSGVAGLLAGAFSMAAGEYVSVRSQREMFEHQIALERAELDEYPEEEAEELALIYRARGVPDAQARSTAARLVADPEHALDTLAREELGLDPAQLGAPFGAALSSFLSFAAGAAVPLLPLCVASGSAALAVSLALTGASLFAVGAAISLFTGRRAARGGLRMLAIGAAAGAVTYGIGTLLGVGLG